MSRPAAPSHASRWVELPVRALMALATVCTVVILCQSAVATLAEAGHPIGEMLRPGTWARTSGALTTAAMLSMGALFTLQRWRLDLGSSVRPRMWWAIPAAVISLALGLTFDLLASQDAVLALMAAGQVLDVLAICLFVLALALDSRGMALRDHDGTVWLLVGLLSLLVLKTSVLTHPALPEHGWVWIVPVGYPLAWATMWNVWSPVPTTPSTARRNLNLLAVAIFMMPLPLLLVPVLTVTSMNALVPIFHLIVVVAAVVTIGLLVLATLTHRAMPTPRVERWIVTIGLLVLVKAGLPDPLPSSADPLPFFGRFEFHEPQAIAGALIVLLGGLRSWLRRRGEPLAPWWIDAGRVAALVGWALVDMARRYYVSGSFAAGDGEGGAIVRTASYVVTALIGVYMVSLLPLVPVVSRIVRGTSEGSIDPAVSPTSPTG